MTIEVINTSGQLVPTSEINSLLTFALLELELIVVLEIHPYHLQLQVMVTLHKLAILILL